MAPSNPNNRIKGKPPFVQLTREILRSQNMRSLTNKAWRLLFEIIDLYNGHNNGDLCITWSEFKKRGWRSSSQLWDAKAELIEKGFIVLSRQGGRHKPSLFALTFHSIDECEGKLEIPATRTPSNLWKMYNQLN